MQNILIVEDDLSQLAMLEHTIKEIYPLWEVHTASSFPAASELIQESVEKKQPFSLFLLDVQLSSEEGDRGGFFLAEKIRSYSIYYQTPLLFLTAVSDKNYFALSHFHCYNYISKPYTAEDIQYQLQQMLMTGYLESNILDIRDTNRLMRRIKISNLGIVEAQSHTITLYSKDMTIVSRQYSLSSLLPLLGTNFIRCHKRYIINLKYAKNLDKQSRYLDIWEHKIPLGANYIPQLELALTNHTL